jgi:ketopantoate reductase
MEITIIGPGAVGTLLGSLLQLKGHRVTLRGRKQPANPNAPQRVVLPGQWLTAEGLRSEGPADAVGSADAFFVTMGRHHLHAERRPDFSRLVGSSDSPVMFWNCDLAEPERLAVDPRRVHFCLTLMNAVSLQACDVELSSEKPVIVHQRSQWLVRMLAGLSGFGFRVLPVDEVRPYANSFFVYQLLHLPVALCNTTMREFLSFPEGRELAVSILHEGCEALERAEMPMASLPIMDPRELCSRLERKPDAFQVDRGAPERAYNSVLQAYLKGKPTEAAQLNRKAVELASSAGLHLTWNWRIFQKAGRVASMGFYRDPAELLSALA